MKKVIDGKLYNTETAEFIGYWDNGQSPREFTFCSETLYRTKSGRYFIHGEGHANSMYGVWHGNSGGWGEQIRPYTAAEARKWAEEHLDAEDYIKAFGEPEEASDTKATLMISISPEFKRRLEKMREDTGKSISQIIEDKFSE